MLDCGGYSFLNPMIHDPAWSEGALPYLLFEGTLTAKESGGKREIFPRALDCQVLYRLDFDDSKMPRCDD